MSWRQFVTPDRRPTEPEPEPGIGSGAMARWRAATELVRRAISVLSGLELKPESHQMAIWTLIDAAGALVRRYGYRGVGVDFPTKAGNRLIVGEPRR